MALPRGAMGFSAVCDCGISDQTHYFGYWLGSFAIFSGDPKPIIFVIFQGGIAIFY